MAEFIANDVQTLAPGADAVWEQSIGCPKGNILFRPQTSQIMVRGVVKNPTARFARYQLTMVGNIAVSAGSTVGPIDISLTIGGAVIPTSTAEVTPAAVGDFFNVTCTADTDVPVGCCPNVSVRNVSVSSDPATTPAPSIDLKNANFKVNRIA